MAWLRASEPAWGSVSAKQPWAWPEATGLRKRSRCASVPKASTGLPYSELLTDITTACDAHTRAISSRATT